MEKNYAYLYGDAKKEFDKIQKLIEKAQNETKKRNKPDNKDSIIDGFALLLCLNLVDASLSPNKGNGSESSDSSSEGLSKQQELLQYILTYAYNDSKTYESGNCASYITSILNYADFKWNPSKDQQKGVLSQFTYLAKDLGMENIKIKNTQKDGVEISITNPSFKLLDLIYLDAYDGSKTQHVMIVVGFDANGNPLLAGNTNDRISLPIEEAIKDRITVDIVRIDFYVDNIEER